MSLLDEKEKAHAFDAAERIRAIQVQQAGDLTSNARWYATLILAVLAGLVNYRQLLQAQGLRQFALVVVVLGVALALFVVASLLAQYAQVEFLNRLRKFSDDVQSIDGDQKLTQPIARSELLEKRRALEKQSDSQWWAHVVQLLGLAVLVVGALVAVVFVFFSELTALF